MRRADGMCAGTRAEPRPRSTKCCEEEQARERFDRFFDRYFDAVHDTAMERLSDRTRAEAVTRDVFEAALECGYDEPEDERGLRMLGLTLRRIALAERRGSACPLVRGLRP